jgi:hypothetical protein
MRKLYYAVYNGSAHRITRAGFLRMTRERLFPHSFSTRQH